MTSDADITAAFWNHLRADRTVMLGLESAAPTILRPMTAQLERTADHGPIWFFTTTDAALVTGLNHDDPAVFTFTSKGHEIMATVHGHMSRTADRALIDRLWTPRIAAWYAGGRDDPTVALLRFDPASAEIWRGGTTLLAGLKLLFGGDPQNDPQLNPARVAMA